MEARLLTTQEENDTRYGDGLGALVALLPFTADLENAIILKRKLDGNHFDVPPIVSWLGSDVCGADVTCTIRVETHTLIKEGRFNQTKGKPQATVVVGRGPVKEHFYVHKGVLVAGNDLSGPIPELGRLAEKLQEWNCPPFSTADVDQFIQIANSLLKLE